MNLAAKATRTCAGVNVEKQIISCTYILHGVDHVSNSPADLPSGGGNEFADR